MPDRPRDPGPATTSQMPVIRRLSRSGYSAESPATTSQMPVIRRVPDRGHRCRSPATTSQMPVIRRRTRLLVLRTAPATTSQMPVIRRRPNSQGIRPFFAGGRRGVPEFQRSSPWRGRLAPLSPSVIPEGAPFRGFDWPASDTASFRVGPCSGPVIAGGLFGRPQFLQFRLQQFQPILTR